MKKLYTLKRMLTAAVLLMMSTLSWACDLYVDGICYNLLSATEVEVTSNEFDYYSGDIVIPSIVTDTNEGKIYSVTSIGKEAFKIFSSITSVYISEGVRSIGEEAFRCCPSLTSISMPESVTSIGNYAFAECYSLTSISIPKGVTSIGDYVFFWCDSLTSVSIPEGVTNIGELAFYGCSSLTSVSIPESVTNIGTEAFGHCYSLTSISIPDSVTSIGEGAFEHCNSLTSVSIPESVTSIGDEVFWCCSSLTSVICYAENVPELVNSIFSFSPISEATLYVPASALEDYKAADQWKNFGRILPLEDIPAGINSIEADDSNAPYYTLDGKRVDAPTRKGIYIKNGKKILIK